MTHQLFPVGSRIRVNSYGPFRGLRGTVHTVDTISADFDEPFCFYQIVIRIRCYPPLECCQQYLSFQHKCRLVGFEVLQELDLSQMDLKSNRPYKTLGVN